MKLGAPWSLAVAALLLAACPRRPLSFGPQGQIQDPNEIVQALAARSSKLHRLRSEVSFSADGASGRGSTRGLVAAERPARLHLELDDFFGNPAAVLTTQGTTLGVYQASSNTFATGLASPRNVASLVPIELPVSEAVDLLFGDPRPLGSQAQEFFVDRGRYSYALLFTTGAGSKERHQRIDVDTETLVPVGETVEGVDPYEARFSDFESDSGFRVLRRLEVDSPGGRIKLSYKSLEINPALSGEIFIPRGPPGAIHKVLDGEGLETSP